MRLHSFLIYLIDAIRWNLCESGKLGVRVFVPRSVSSCYPVQRYYWSLYSMKCIR
jgi:hypothetical protein